MSTPFPLGRRQEHDPRSRGFAAAVEPVVVSKAWRRYGTVLDQGDLGSCTGNAGIHALNSVPLHVIGAVTGKEPDAVSLYASATRVDEFPGFYDPADPANSEDTGSSGLAISKVLQSQGRIAAYEWAFGLDHVLGAAMRGPLMVGTDWREDMFWPDATGLVRPTGDIAGGHEYVLSGVNLTHRRLRFQNSWSSGWGDRGKFYMTFDDFAVLLAAGGDAIALTR